MDDEFAELSEEELRKMVDGHVMRVPMERVRFIGGPLSGKCLYMRGNMQTVRVPVRQQPDFFTGEPEQFGPGFDVCTYERNVHILGEYVFTYKERT